jgi:hypothetical protein
MARTPGGFPLPRLTSLLLLGSTLLLWGCGGDSPTDPGQEGGDTTGGFMTARIDGAEWRTFTPPTVTFASNAMGFAGVAAEGTTISIGLVPDGPGTYAVGPGFPTNMNVARTGSVWQAAVTRGSGSVTFTTFTDRGATGTFSFVAPAATGNTTGTTRTVTEGRFTLVF